MSIDKSREEFEAAYVADLVRRCGEGFRESALYSLSEKKPNGDYQHYTDFLAWWAWQASRAALVIELCEPGSGISPDGWNEFDAAKVAIENSGVTVKVTQ